MEGASRHVERRGELVQFVEAGVTHQMTPAAFTKPPVRAVDVESQRRRSGRTRTGTGLGRAPRMRTPAPIPTAVATMVTIQDAMPSNYSQLVQSAGRMTISVRIRNRCRSPHRHVAREWPTGRPTRRPTHRPRRTPTRGARHRRARPDRWPVRWRPPWSGAPRRLRRRSCSGTRRAAWGQCRCPIVNGSA